MLYAGSFLLHAGIAVAVSAIPTKKKETVVAISMTDAKRTKKEEAKPAPPPPPPPKEAATPKAKVLSPPKAPDPLPPPETAKPSEPPPKGMEGYTALPDPMGNGGGVALPPRQAASAPPRASASAPPVKQLQAAPALSAQDGCNEPIVRARRKGGPQPAYSPQARQAEIEGLVRVDVTIDETGRVASARVAQGLGHGLDEQALAAAKRWSFEPATRCGRPVLGAASLPFRFKLGQ